MFTMAMRDVSCLVKFKRHGLQDVNVELLSDSHITDYAFFRDALTVDELEGSAFGERNRHG